MVVSYWSDEKVWVEQKLVNKMYNFRCYFEMCGGFQVEMFGTVVCSLREMLGGRNIDLGIINRRLRRLLRIWVG